APASQGIFHMIVSNPVIEVSGDTATARFTWTGVLNSAIDAPPTITEQGREYDLLVRDGGQWKISKRVVIADSGLPERYRATYQPRLDCETAAEPYPRPLRAAGSGGHPAAVEGHRQRERQLQGGDRRA